MEEKLETVLQIRFKMLVFTSAWLKASVLEVGMYSRRRTDPREIRSDVARFPRCKKKFWSGAMDARSHPGGGLRHQTSILSLRWTHICWTVCTVPHMLAYSISYSWNQLFIRQSFTHSWWTMSPVHIIIHCHISRLSARPRRGKGQKKEVKLTQRWLKYKLWGSEGARSKITTFHFGSADASDEFLRYRFTVLTFFLAFSSR